MSCMFFTLIRVKRYFFSGCRRTVVYRVAMSRHKGVLSASRDANILTSYSIRPMRLHILFTLLIFYNAFEPVKRG